MYAARETATEYKKKKWKKKIIIIICSRFDYAIFCSIGGAGAGGGVRSECWSEKRREVCPRFESTAYGHRATVFSARGTMIGTYRKKVEDSPLMVWYRD